MWVGSRREVKQILRHMHTDLNLKAVFPPHVLQTGAEVAAWPARFVPRDAEIKVKPSNHVSWSKCQMFLHCFPLAKSAFKPFLQFRLDIDLSYSQALGKVSIGLFKGWIMPLTMHP